MGYDSQPLWQRHREDFPVTRNLIYMNHAGVGPLARPAAEAMKHFAQDALDFASVHYSEWLDAYQGLRVAAARLIGSQPGEVAIVKNTSEGVATVANGIDWKSGDRVVAFREEFPANYFPWLRLESKGVEIDWRSVEDPLEEIDQACEGARLLAISFVNYLSGYRANLETLGEICDRRGCLFFVDAIQGLGAFPLDVRKAGIHALAADGHKWMLGPEGCGILYVRQDVQDGIEPVEFGWTNAAKYADYASRDMTLRPDAGRYECGTLNTIGCFGLRAAIEFLLKVGIASISDAILALSARLCDGLEHKGYEALGDRNPERSSGIVSFRKPGVESRRLVSRLRQNGIIAAPRQGWVRASPHFYISPDEVGRLVELLD